MFLVLKIFYFGIILKPFTAVLLGMHEVACAVVSLNIYALTICQELFIMQILENHHHGRSI